MAGTSSQVQNNMSQTVARRVGRPRRLLNVQRIYESFDATHSFAATARALNLPPGTVWDVLRRAGKVASSGKKRQRGDGHA